MGTVCSSPAKGDDSNKGRGRRLTTMMPSGNGIMGTSSEFEVFSEKGSCDLGEWGAHQVTGIVPNSVKVNQDRFIAQPCGGYFVVGALDGHGPEGEKVSAFVKEHLCDEFQSKLAQEGATLPQALVDGTFAVEKATNKNVSIDTSYSGTTVTLTAIRDVDGAVELTSANAGDSRCVLVSLASNPDKYIAEDLTTDHKPEIPSEMTRINACGGEVRRYKIRGQEVGPMRVWLKGENFPGIAISRSLGDEIATGAGVTTEPDVTLKNVSPGKDGSVAVVCGSDGLWDMISSSDAAEIVGMHLDSARAAAETLASVAHSQWTSQEEVIDDITAVVFIFKKPTGEEEQDEDSEKEADDGGD